VTGFNDLSAAQVNTEVDTALSDVGLTSTVTGRIDTTVSSRLAASSYTAPDNATITTISGNVSAIKAKTDNLPTDPADASDIATSFASTNDLILTVDAVADAIKVKTDQMTFGVANTLNSNLTYVNNTLVKGTGISGDEWGPA
jgi:hypothetical protein